MARYYASLTGPLLGLYFPLPKGLNALQMRRALNTSKLKSLWCLIYSANEVQEQISKWGGIVLPDEHANRLDYDYDTVWK